MNKKKMIIIVAMVSLFLLGSVGAGFYLIWTKISNMTSPAQTAAGVAEKKPGKDKPAGMGPVLNLDTFIVNLADDDAQRFLKTTITLEMNAPEAIEEANSRLPQIKDYIVTLLPTKKSTDVLSADGKQILRTQLTAGLNRFLTKGKIASLYFTDFVIQ